MKKITPVILALASLALAQAPSVTRGGALLKKQYQTSAAVTLYVDGTLGADTNPCTASGASACATINGAISKLPDRIRHDVTINVAAGTYAEEINLLEGQRFEGVNTSSATAYRSVRLSLTGAALTTYTPAAGNSSGTFTAPARSGGFVTVTDASQGLTVDALRGRFITFTGTGGGTYVISENTATTITFLSNGTLPVTGTAYTLTTPSVIITGAAVKQATMSLGTLSANYVLSNLEVTNTTKPAIKQAVPATSLVETLGWWTGSFMRITTGASISGAAQGGSLTDAYVSTTHASVAALSTAIPPNRVVVDGVAAAVALSTAQQRNFTHTLTDIRANPTSTSAALAITGPYVGAGAGASFAGLRIKCANTTLGTGLRVYSGASIGFGGGSAAAPITITDCARAIQFGEFGGYTNSGNSFTLDTITCTNTYNCLYVTGGDKLMLGAISVSGVTQEILLDNNVPAGNIYTVTEFTAMNPQRITTSLGTVIRTFGN